MNIYKLIVVVLLVQSVPGFAADRTALQVASSFYAWVIKHDGGGLPSRAKLKGLDSDLSDELKFLLRASLDAEARCVAAAPDGIKPRIFEGSPFVENYESLSQVVSLRSTKTEAGVVIASRLAYFDAHNPIYTWFDRLRMKREHGQWVVADAGGVARSATLVAILKKYNSKEECGI